MLVKRAWLHRGLLVFVILTALSFHGLLSMYLHTYYISSDRTVKTRNDPRWRVVDCNSRQATESEIYSVAEIPVIRNVRFAGRRMLRFEFSPPIPAPSWKVRSRTTGAVLKESPEPEIQFPDISFTDTFILEPQGVTPTKEIALTISFAPAESVYRNSLSWPDNYWRSFSSVPFSTKKPYGIDEWAGIAADDPEILKARQIMEGEVDFAAPVLKRSEQVFRFIMSRIASSGGVPSDRVQAASPLDTYRLLLSGEGKGWCENRAPVYYLFANAAGIKTRLVDIAGKFGPLKLTGHYFCESWFPEEGSWFFVDPQSFIANISDTLGHHITSLGLKKHCDLQTCSSLTVRRYVPDSDSFVTDTAYPFKGLSDYLTGDIVMAYKFGYGNNKSMKKMSHFLKYTTLLYAPFPLPKLYLVKTTCMAGFIAGIFLTLIFVMCLIVSYKTEHYEKDIIQK